MMSQIRGGNNPEETQAIAGDAMIVNRNIY